MASNLFTPVLNDRTRAPHFFNGRLLTGEAMTDEQRAHHVARELLAQAVGDGVAYGLEVEKATLVTTLDRPVVTVKSGVAVNRRGEVLLLTADTDVQLVRPAETSVSPTTIFRACTPVSTGAYVADAGVYLLTVSSIRAGNGLAKVSGLGDAPAACNIQYIVDAVEFRLLELPVSPGALSDTNRLRNRVAYECFGVGDLGDDPFGTPATPSTPLDKLREDGELTDCDVPLCVLYWTASGGIVFVDLWSVRRRITRTNTATSYGPLSDRRVAAAEAMVLQFDEHIAGIPRDALTATIDAATHFRYLPPVGRLPTERPGLFAFSPSTFFTELPHRDPEYIDASAMTVLVREAVLCRPIDVRAHEMVWLYVVWQNDRDKRASASLQTYVVFASPFTRYLATPRFDVTRWDFGRYSSSVFDVAT